MPETWLAFRGESRLIKSDITFKAMSDDDMAFLSELYRTTRWQEVQQAPWDDEQRKVFLHQQFTAQHEHYITHYPNAEKLLIIKKNEAIGRIYVDRDEVSICLIDVALMPKYKHRGIGTTLLKELLTEAQKGGKKVLIHVENFNPAYQWYIKHGFQHIEDKGVYQYMEWHPQNFDQVKTAS
jgi:GNAT superfamily N-acetyltransferase